MYFIVMPDFCNCETSLHVIALDVCVNATINDYTYTITKDGVDVTAEFAREVRAICANRKGAA